MFSDFTSKKVFALGNGGGGGGGKLINKHVRTLLNKFSVIGKIGTESAAFVLII